MKIAIEFTMAEAKALEMAAGNSLMSGDDAEAVCGPRAAKFAYLAQAKLRAAIVEKGGYDKKPKKVRS